MRKEKKTADEMREYAEMLRAQLEERLNGKDAGKAVKTVVEEVKIGEGVLHYIDVEPDWEKRSGSQCAGNGVSQIAEIAGFAAFHGLHCWASAGNDPERGVFVRVTLAV